MERTLLYNCFLVTMNHDRTMFENGFVVFESDKIIDIGDASNIYKYQDCKKINCNGNIVIPGLVESLGYAGSGIAGSIYGDSSLKWQRFYQNSLLKIDDRDFWYLEGLLEGIQRLRFGITSYTAAIPIVSEAQLKNLKAYKKGLSDSSIHTTFCVGTYLPTSKDIGEYHHRHSISIEALRDLEGSCFMGAFIGADFPLRNGVFEPETYSGELETLYSALSALNDSSRRNDVGLYLELPGNLIRLVNDHCGEALENTIVAHGYGMGYDEVAILSDHHSSVIYAPETYLGRVPLPELINLSVKVAISSGSRSSRQSADLFQVLRQASLYEITYQDDYGFLPAGCLLETITTHAASIWNNDMKCGSLEIGKDADFVIIDWKQPHMTPNFMPVHSLVFRAMGADVSMVVSKGEIICRDGMMNKHDLDGLMMEARRMGEKFFTNCQRSYNQFGYYYDACAGKD